MKRPIQRPNNYTWTPARHARHRMAMMAKRQNGGNSTNTVVNSTITVIDDSEVRCICDVLRETKKLTPAAKRYVMDRLVQETQLTA